MYKKIINILLNEKDPESRLTDIYALFEKTYNKPLVYYTDGTQSHTLREKSIVWKKCHAADPFIKELVNMDIQLNHIFYAESWSSDNYKCIFVPMDDEIKNQQRLIELLITILNINPLTRKLLIKPNITTRGFVLVNENAELINQIEKKI